MREEELVEHCKQKDKSAQKQLYELYAGALFALCIRYSGNREAAEDILHDGFLQLVITAMISNAVPNKLILFISSLF